MTDPALFDPQLVRVLNRVRSRGIAAVLAFDVPSVPETSRLVLAPSLDHLERAYDDAKYGLVSGNPLIAAQLTADASGRGRVEAHVQYVPYESDEETNEALWALLVAQMRGCLAPYVSGMADAPVVKAMTPRDFEANAVSRRGSRVTPRSRWIRRSGCVRCRSSRNTGRRSKDSTCVARRCTRRADDRSGRGERGCDRSARHEEKEKEIGVLFFDAARNRARSEA